MQSHSIMFKYTEDERDISIKENKHYGGHKLFNCLLNIASFCCLLSLTLYVYVCM